MTYRINNIESLKLGSPVNVLHQSITKLDIICNKPYNNIQTIDISAFINVEHMIISSNARLVVHGLDKCAKLNCLEISHVKFEPFANNSLTELTIIRWNDDVLDLTGLHNLNKLILSSTICASLDLTLLSNLPCLKQCVIEINATGIVKSSSITCVKYTGSNTIMFDLPNIESYEGKLVSDILTNPNLKALTVTDDDNCPFDTVVNLPKLESLSIASKHAMLYNKIIVNSPITHVTISINSITDHRSISNFSTVAHVKILKLNSRGTLDIADIVNKFRSIDKLIVSLKKGIVKIGNNINCLIHHVSINNNIIRFNHLKHFNLAKLAVLKCNVYNPSNDKLDIPTLTTLYCNQFILTNGSKLKKYKGPNAELPNDVCKLNAGTIIDISKFSNIAFDKLPNLKSDDILRKIDVVLCNKRTNSNSDDDNSSNSAVHSIPQYIFNDDPIQLNIDRLLSKCKYIFCFGTSYDTKLNASYHYIKRTLIKDRSRITIEKIINTIVKSSKDNEDRIVAIVNEVFNNHINADVTTIMKNLFAALNGICGIIMDTKKYEIKKKIDELQRELDQLKAELQ